MADYRPYGLVREETGSSVVHWGYGGGTDRASPRDGPRHSSLAEIAAPGVKAVKDMPLRGASHP